MGSVPLTIAPRDEDDGEIPRFGASAFRRRRFGFDSLALHRRAGDEDALIQEPLGVEEVEDFGEALSDLHQTTVPPCASARRRRSDRPQPGRLSPARALRPRGIPPGRPQRRRP